MLTCLKELGTKIRSHCGRFLQLLKGNHWGILALILSFSLGLFFINMTMARSSALRHLKVEILQVERYLNELGLDIAYEELKTSAIYTRPLITMKNFQIYKPGEWSLNVPLLKFKSSVWNSHRFYILLGDTQSFELGDKKYDIKSDDVQLQLSTDEHNRLDLILAKTKNIDVKNLFKIKELNIAGRRVGSHDAGNSLLSYFENHIELKDFQFNGLVDYPLTSTISRLYLKTNFIGWLEPDELIMTALEDWLHHGGYIAIPSLIINWEPMNMVARGEINFSETLQPRLHLMTSSKALMKLLDDLQDRTLLESKGVFVAKILLNNKAFKLETEDKHLTVITPIDYQEGKISVENITVRNFNPQKKPTQP